MTRPLDHPNDPGRWTLVRVVPGATLWRRDRNDPFPVTMFYLVMPPDQPRVVYDEAGALALLESALVTQST
jgi:hypothetical protein